MKITPGSIVARSYEVIGPLGRGGMGELFVARNLRTERKVALKILRTDAKARADTVQRFEREARASGIIKSEHVTQVLDVEDDKEFGIVIAFELLEGESLLERLRRTGPLTFEALHPYVRQILLGLRDAHAVGIIHRDLKPSNIFLEQRPDGSSRVKILDFGISKLPKSVAKTTLTEPGQSLGSFMFMPPEQIQRAANVDARADIYALGSLIFQSLTGRLPFDTQNMTEMVRLKASSEARKLSEVFGPRVAPALDAWVARSLRRDPNQRFGSTDEALAAWDALAADPSEQTIADGPPIMGERTVPGPSNLPLKQTKFEPLVAPEESTTRSLLAQAARPYEAPRAPGAYPYDPSGARSSLQHGAWPPPEAYTGGYAPGTGPHGGANDHHTGEGRVTPAHFGGAQGSPQGHNAPYANPGHAPVAGGLAHRPAYDSASGRPGPSVAPPHAALPAIVGSGRDGAHRPSTAPMAATPPPAPATAPLLAPHGQPVFPAPPPGYGAAHSSAYPPAAPFNPGPSGPQRPPGASTLGPRSDLGGYRPTGASTLGPKSDPNAYRPGPASPAQRPETGGHRPPGASTLGPNSDPNAYRPVGSSTLGPNSELALRRTSLAPPARSASAMWLYVVSAALVLGAAAVIVVAYLVLVRR